MKIEHVDGNVVDTNKLPDVDALLLEESKKLYDLFVKYNRQLLLVSDVKANNNATINSTSTFFNMGPEDLLNDKEKLKQIYDLFFGIINRSIKYISRDTLVITVNPEIVN